MEIRLFPIRIEQFKNQVPQKKKKNWLICQYALKKIHFKSTCPRDSTMT